MSSPYLDLLIQSSPTRTYAKQVLLIQEGDLSDHLFVLLRGRVRAFSTGADGKEVIFNEYHPPDFFGEMSLDGGPRSASVMTLEPCECAVVTRAALVQFLDNHPGFALELVAKVIERARQATHAARNLALLDVYGRLKAFLEQVPATVENDQRRLLHRYTHADIGRRLGASREMISKLLKDLEKGKYLDTSGELWRVRPLPERW